MVSFVELAVMEERCRKSTPPPWESGMDCWPIEDGDLWEYHFLIRALGPGAIGSGGSYAAVSFAAEAREDLPYLVNLARKLMAARPEECDLTDDEVSRLSSIRDSLKAAPRGTWQLEEKVPRPVTADDGGSIRKWLEEMRKSPSITNEYGDYILCLSLTRYPEDSAGLPWDNDADFIVHAKEDIGGLLQAVEELAGRAPRDRGKVGYATPRGLRPRQQS